jgi:hypothetical protein
MNSATPYADGAPIYQAKGWAGIIPLPPGKKWPPPKAYTGWDGKDPSAKMIETWCSETSGDYQASSNVGIRAPHNAVGFDARRSRSLPMTQSGGISVLKK